MKVGDPASSLPAANVTGKPDEGGWVGFRGREHVFRIEDDKIAAMDFADEAVLGRLTVRNEDDLNARLGPGLKIEAGPADPAVKYYFKDRGLSVWFNRTAGKVTEVTVGS